MAIPYDITRRSFLASLQALAATAAGKRALGPALGGPGAFNISGIDVTLSLTFVSEHTLRISLLPASAHHDPAAAFRSTGLRTRDWPAPSATLRRPPAQPVSWGDRQIHVTTDPLRISITADGQPLQSLDFDPATARVSFDLHDSPVFGLGEGGHQFDRRGVIDAMRNGQFKPDQFQNGGRSPIPWLLSPAGWGLYFHHPLGTFDLTGKRGVFRPSAAAEAQDIFLVLSRDPAVLLQEFAQLTGMPHLPPVWAFGYQQSHRTLSSREAVLAEVQTFREKRLPCDVMIYLGTGFAPSGWNTGHASFAFNPRIFPDPAQMFSTMHEQGIKTVLHVLGVPADLHGSVADTADPDPDSAANYWADHLPTFRTGIDGWWVDDGDELEPEARLTRNRMYWQGALQERPNTRPFSIQRNGYAGLQQYGFLWSGDVNSEWKTLRTQIAAGLNTALSGIPYWGTDTGGFFSTPELTAELYVRWFQFSAFCPLFRSHGRTWMLRLPWGWNRGELGPVEDDAKLLPRPEDLHHPEVETICRTFLNLRYQLLPYTYTAAWQTHRTGIPLMRPLWFAFPQDPRATLVDDAYMWGPRLLVAPVTEKSATERRTWLPPGTWFDYWTGERIAGTSEHLRKVDLATMPLYVMAGSIIPHGPIRQYTTEPSAEPIELRIYPSADATATLYEDDGVSMDYASGASSVLDLTWNDAAATLHIHLAPGSRFTPHTTRQFRVTRVGSDVSRLIHFAGSPIEARL